MKIGAEITSVMQKCFMLVLNRKMCPGLRYFNYPLSMTHPTVQLNWFKLVNWSTWGTMFQLSQNSGRLKWKISWNNSNDIVLSINVEQNKIRQYLSMISTYLLSPCCEWPLNERIISKNDILPPRYVEKLNCDEIDFYLHFYLSLFIFGLVFSKFF